MLTASDLASLRATQESLMPDTCVIERRTLGARDAYADRSETWATVATVPCRLAIAAGGNSTGEVVTAMQTLSAITSYALTVPWQTNVQGSDRVTVNGARYEVKATPKAVSYMTAKRVALLCVEMA